MRRVMRTFRDGAGAARPRLAHDGRGLRARRGAAVGLRQSKPRQALDRAQEIALFMVAERDRQTRGAGARGAADAVNIGLGDFAAARN